MLPNVQNVGLVVLVIGLLGVCVYLEIGSRLPATGPSGNETNEEGLARREARETRRPEAREGTREERDAARETCTLRCTRENERDTWLQRERATHERERAHTR